ncbi:MAG TPA: hypothetical protein VFP65_26970 [Anaeromyxobacteraceae bacterium]|nr:hypothetical protein [Anaeromyxobacteraceae bacterium]
MSPPIAKISRPALKGVVVRARLLRHLDRLLRDHPVVWIGAPAGSGKTTLASSWIEARRGPCLWYHVDSGDADPATFFYYAREAVSRAAGRKRIRLPLLTPEYARGLDVYVRRFFESAGAAVPPGTVLVLDDYQDCPADAPLHALLPLGLAALPPGIPVVVLSRSAPPPAFARHLAHGRIGFITGDELDLSAAETRALARGRAGAIPAARVAAVHARTRGWLAGTLLMLEGARRRLPAPATAESSEQQVLFEYFAAELFDRSGREDQHVLLATAVLPEIDAAAAVALSGDGRAGEILSDLVRRNFFTARLPGAAARYRLHPLFREFLLSRARQAFGVAGWDTHLDRAAEILVRGGRAEDAAAILIAEGARDGLVRLVAAHAPALAAQGRRATIASWVGALPERTVREDPWLSYWAGMCSAPEQARAHLERAYRSFASRGDVPGLLSAWSGYVATFLYVWDRFDGLDPWIAEMEALGLERLEGMPPEISAQVAFGMLASLMWRRASHPDTERWADRAAALVDADIAPELRMQLATYVVFYRVWWKGDDAGAAAVVSAMRSLAAGRDVMPLAQILWCIIEATFEARMGRGAACFAAVDRGLALARDTGIAGLEHQLAIQGAYGALATGDLEVARRYHRSARAHLAPDQRANAAHFWHVGAWIELCSGNLDAARACAERGLAPADGSGADPARPWLDHTLAAIALERGEPRAALELWGRSLAWARGARNAVMEHDALLMLAEVHRRGGEEPRAVDRLREALRLGREHHVTRHPWNGWRRDVMARLAALAFEHGIEVEHVTEYVHANELVAPGEATPERWPWPVRIRTLGPFELWRGGSPVVFSGKLPRKPLELLHALAALGASSPSEQVVADELWPEMDGAAGRHALETTLYRLRRILGDPTLVVRSGGALKLDASRVWTDVDALNVRMAAARGSLQDGANDLERVRWSVTGLLELYRGPPFSHLEAQWAIKARERIRGAVVRVLRVALARLASAGDRAAVDECLEHLAHADPELRQRLA